MGVKVSDAFVVAVRYRGNRLNRPGAADGDERGAVPNAEPRGPVQGSGAHLRQQAGPQRIHVGRRDKQAARPHVHQETAMAHPVVLCAHRGRVSKAEGNESPVGSNCSKIAFCFRLYQGLEWICSRLKKK